MEKLAKRSSLNFSRVLKVLPILVGDVLKDVLSAQRQNSGQHFDRMLVADVEKFVDRDL